jgi:hypothetical protein
VAGGVGVDGVVGEEGAGSVDAAAEAWDVPAAPFCFVDQGEDEHPATARPAANVHQNTNGDRSMQSEPSHPEVPAQ